MTDPILTQLARLRDAYLLHLTRLESSDMDPLFRRVRMKQMREAIAELEKQIANLEPPGEPRECSIDASKRYADCHEQ